MGVGGLRPLPPSDRYFLSQKIRQGSAEIVSILCGGISLGFLFQRRI